MTKGGNPNSGQLPTRPLCPYCDAASDGWGDPAGEPSRAPEVGDVALCLYCGEMSLYTAALMLRKPDVFEAAQLAADPDYREARQIWESFIAAHPDLRRVPR